MILNLLGAIALSSLVALPTQQNDISIYSSSNDKSVSGSFTDFYDVGGYKLIGISFNYDNERSVVLDYDQITYSDITSVAYGTNRATSDYILVNDAVAKDYDLFLLAQCVNVLGNTYAYSFNWYFGEYFEGQRVNLIVRFTDNGNLYDAKSSYGFPYALKQLSESHPNADDGNISNYMTYCDGWSAFSLEQGGADTGNVDNTRGWRNLYPCPYGYYWTQQGLTQYDIRVDMLSIDAEADYRLGYSEGEKSGLSAGRQQGYQEGINFANNQNSVAMTIFAGIIDVALLPINFFLAVFNFEVFGINIGAFVSATLTITIVVILFRTIFGSGSKKE